MAQVLDPNVLSGAAGAGGVSAFGKAMGVAGPIMSLMGMANSAIGAYYGAKSAKLQTESQALNFESQRLTMEFQSQITGINARMIEDQAQQLYRVGRQREMMIGLQAGALKGQTRASLAARGIQAGVGSAAEIVATSDLMKEIDLITANSNTVRAVEAERMRKVGVEASSTMQSLSAQNLALSADGARASGSSISPWSAAGSSLLSGAGTTANLWYQRYRQTN